MSKPVTPQDMFDLWQKMVNPGGYPLQSLMFPVLDAKEIERKIAELQVVEHWLRANLNMLAMSIKSLEYQRALLKGGEKFTQQMAGDKAQEEGVPQPNPAMWAWDMMAKAGQDAMSQVAQAAQPKPAAKKRRAKPEK